MNLLIKYVPMNVDKNILADDTKIYHYTSFKNALSILRTKKLITQGFGISFTTNPKLNYNALIGLSGVEVSLCFDKNILDKETTFFDYEYNDSNLDVGNESEIRANSNKLSLNSLESIRVYKSYEDKLKNNTFDEYLTELKQLSWVAINVIIPPWDVEKMNKLEEMKEFNEFKKWIMEGDNVGSYAQASPLSTAGGQIADEFKDKKEIEDDEDISGEESPLSLVSEDGIATDSFTASLFALPTHMRSKFRKKPVTKRRNDNSGQKSPMGSS